MTWWMDQSPRSASGALRSQLPAWLNRRQPHRVDLRDPHSKNPWKSRKIAMFGHIYLLYHNCKPALYHNCKPALWTSEKQCAVSDHELCRIGQIWWLLEVLEVITKYTKLLLYHHRSLPESNVAGWGNPRNIIYKWVYFQRSIFDEQARHFGSVLFNTQTDAEKLQSWSNYVGLPSGGSTQIYTVYLDLLKGSPPKKTWPAYRFPKWWILYGEDTTKNTLSKPRYTMAGCQT